MSTPLSRCLACLGLCVLASSSHPEEPVELLRAPTEVSTPRAIAMGGALAGLGGDISAAAANPASLIAVPRSLDVTLAGGTKGGYSGGGAFHPFRRWAFGLYLPTADSRGALEGSGPAASRLAEVRPSDGRWTGLAVAYKLHRRLALGGSLQCEHLNLDEAGPGWSRQAWANWSVGAFVQPDDPDAARIGLAYRHGADRTLENGLDLAVRVRRPDVVAMGVSWQYGWLRNARVVMSLQPELVRYPSEAGAGAASERGASNELDLRAGVEASFPFGRCVTGCGGLFQVRAGFITRSSIPGQAVRERGRTANWAAGIAVAPPKPGGGKFRLDLSYSHEFRSVTLGLAWRFPEAFRGDLQHHRRRRPA